MIFSVSDLVHSVCLEDHLEFRRKCLLPNYIVEFQAKINKGNYIFPVSEEEHSLGKNKLKDKMKHKSKLLH